MRDRPIRFSQRHGYSSVRDTMQRESMDSDLRNGLWSLLYESYFEQGLGTGLGRIPKRLRELYSNLWKEFFKKPVDTIPGNETQRQQAIREWFFGCQWYRVYDLIEAVPQLYDGVFTNREFRNVCNDLLTRELAGYRFVDERIVPITAEEEIVEIEEALTRSGPLPGVQEHLMSALTLLGEEENPNYRNVIKEAISAVESLSVAITGKDKATLGQALQVIDQNIELHGALKSAFEKLYGYTSDEGGIRHALMEESRLDQEDAKFMLVACSAFVNYLLVKASKADLELE